MLLQGPSLIRALQHETIPTKIAMAAYRVEKYCCVNSSDDLSVGCSCIAVITLDEGEDL